MSEDKFREQFEAAIVDDIDLKIYKVPERDTKNAWYGFNICAKIKDAEIAELKERLFEMQNDTIELNAKIKDAEKENSELKSSQELEELKRTINQCWYLAYPESMVETGKEKLRVFNLYQDLRDTRWNYRVLHKAYNEMDKEQK